jgi:hypothetical protein
LGTNGSATAAGQQDAAQGPDLRGELQLAGRHGCSFVVAGRLSLWARLIDETNKTSKPAKKTFFMPFFLPVSHFTLHFA